MFLDASCQHLHCIPTRIQTSSYIRGNVVFLYVGWTKLICHQTCACDGMMVSCNNNKPNQTDNGLYVLLATTTTTLYTRLSHYTYRYTSTQIQRIQDQQILYRNLQWVWGMKNRRLRWNWITIQIKVHRRLFSNKTWIIIRPNKPDVNSGIVEQ